MENDLILREVKVIPQSDPRHDQGWYDVPFVVGKSGRCIYAQLDEILGKELCLDIEPLLMIEYSQGTRYPSVTRMCIGCAAKHHRDQKELASLDAALPMSVPSPGISHD